MDDRSSMCIKEALRALFERNQRIHYLRLNGFFLNGRCFSKLNALAIKEILFEDIRGLTDVSLGQLLMECSLSVFSIKRCFSRPDYNQISFEINQNILSALSCQQTLKKLTLHSDEYTAFDQTTLVRLLNNNKESLLELNLYATEFSMHGIKCMKHLTRLFIEGFSLKQTSISSFENLYNLKQVIITNYYYILFFNQ